MNLIVCLSQVPDTATRVKIGSDERHIDEQGVSYVVNPYDEYAIEAALQLKESDGGTVTAVAIGPDRTTSALRTALALGCDEAVHLKTGEPAPVYLFLGQEPYRRMVCRRQLVKRSLSDEELENGA